MPSVPKSSRSKSISGKLDRKFSMFLRFLEGNFLENPSQNYNGMTDFSQEKSLKIVERVKYSIRYCKMSLLLYSGSSSSSNAGVFFDSPVIVRS